jgi:hypothetical protein
MYKSNPIFTQLHAQFVVKAYKQLEGRRGIAWSCNMYFGTKKVASIENEGCGGGTEINFNKHSEQVEFVAKLREVGFDKAMVEGYTLGENEKSFYKPDHKFCDYSLLEAFAEFLIVEFENKKSIKKILKNCDKNICVGNIEEYQMIGFKITLAEVVKSHGIKYVQEAYDNAIAKIKENPSYQILNTKEQLDELGVKQVSRKLIKDAKRIALKK